MSQPVTTTTKPVPVPVPVPVSTSCPAPLQSGRSSSVYQHSEEDDERKEYGERQHFKRQQLVNFGHSQWGFKNWNWTVTKQDIDFVDFTDSKYHAGVVTFVSVTVKSMNIHREDVGYATGNAETKGSAIKIARKISITNALKETLFSFGGSIATNLSELLKSNRANRHLNMASHSSSLENDPTVSNNSQPPSESSEIKTSSNPKTNQTRMERKNSSDSSVSAEANQIKSDNKSSPQRHNNNAPVKQNQDPVNFRNNPKAPTNHQHNNNKNQGMNYNTAPSKPGINPPPQNHNGIHPGNVSYVVQRVMPPLYSVQCATTPPPPPIYHNSFYTEFSPWPLTYENYDRHQSNVNFNFNLPPKNFVLNSRPNMEMYNASQMHCPLRNGAEHESNNHHPQMSHPVNLNGSWIKPTIFYDGFWTEQKVKKWVSEQSEKSYFHEDGSCSTANAQNHMCHSKV